MSTPLLRVKDLAVDFFIRGELQNSPLRGISFDVEAGKTLGIVGETGCGKTLTALAILHLLPKNASVNGQMWVDGIGELNETDMTKVRGSEISIIFQNPHAAFNPVFTIGAQLRIVARARKIPTKEIEGLLTERLHAVGLEDSTRVLNSFPHQLSGGMLQRCMIAMALIKRPRLLIADEPTTALDTTVGKAILTLIKELQRKEGFAMIFISHNVGVISEVSDDVAVLYAGKIVETGPTAEVLQLPQHPYSQGLLGALPTKEKERGKLNSIPGQVPQLKSTMEGCSFQERCSLRTTRCLQTPELHQVANSLVACWEVK